jgi:hypothetical protein
MTITYEPMAGFPTFGGTQRELTATDKWLIAGTDINALYLYLFPPPVLLIPQLPARMDGSSVLFASSLALEPQMGEDDVPTLTAVTNWNGSTGHLNTYRKYYATIQYKSIPFQQSNSGNTIYTTKWSSKAEIMKLPNYGLKWSSDDKPVGDETLNAGKPVIQAELSLSLQRVPVIPIATILNLLGKINNSPFNLVATECLLFSGIDISQETTSDGSQPYTVELKWASRLLDGDPSLGWNHYYRQSTGKFERLKRKDGSPVFASADMSALLS